MAKRTTQTLLANGTLALGAVRKKRDLDSWTGLFVAYGTWGSGTLTWQFSPDGGTTKLTIKDLSGNDITSTADDNFLTNFATGSSNDDPIFLYATLAGATNPNIKVIVYDNSY